MEQAFKFIIENRGITTESSYGYTGVRGKCKNWLLGNHRKVKITGYEYVPRNNELALLKAVSNQPVSVSIDAASLPFRFYGSGVFTGKCSTVTNHGVTVVGYGETEEGIKYWLVKNSWGTSWGENGYIRMQRDVQDKEGLCGIASIASYPTI